MNIQIINKKLSQIKADVELVLVVNKNLKHKWVRDLTLLKEQNYKGKEEEVIYLPHKKKLYIGVDSTEHDNLRLAAAQAVQAVKTKKIKSIKLGLYGGDLPAGAKAMAEGFILGFYEFNNYKSKPVKSSLSRVIFSTEFYEKVDLEFDAVKKTIAEGEIIAQATNYVRDIVNQTPSEMTPIRMSAMAKELAKNKNLSVKVYGEDYLKKEGMGAFLAVSQASSFPPQLIHFVHKAEKPIMKIAIVGKGVTYDTGGLSLKPAKSMVTMKMDKGGGCAVFGIMKAVSELNLPIEVHGIAGVVENAIGKDAFRPDDVVIAKNKKTIEIRHTDAEGRLVLADCLCYAQEQKPDYIIDLATLTGACVVALGQYTTGIMGHNNDFKRDMMLAGEKSGELTANLPFNRYLPKLLKSEVADISNISSAPYGGAITAGLFLSEFIEKKYKNKWLHLDIAGPSYTEKPWGYNPYGGSGAGVRLVIEWFKSLI